MSCGYSIKYAHCLCSSVWNAVVGISFTHRV